MAKIQIIYGIHAVKAALNNEKRVNEELLIHVNHREIAAKYRSRVKKINAELGRRRGRRGSRCVSRWCRLTFIVRLVNLSRFLEASTRNYGVGDSADE